MRKSAGLSVADETKRMTCRVRIDPPAARAFADVEQRGAEPQDLFVGLIEILEPRSRWNCCGRAGSGRRGGRWCSTRWKGRHELQDVGTVQHHTLEPGDHESQRRPSAPRTLSRRDHDGGNLSYAGKRPDGGSGSRAPCGYGPRLRLAVLPGDGDGGQSLAAGSCVPGICTTISRLSRAPPHRRRSSPLQNRPASYQSGRRPPGSRPIAW